MNGMEAVWLALAATPLVALMAAACGSRTRRLLAGAGPDRPLWRLLRLVADLPRPVEDRLVAAEPLPRPLDLAVATGTCPVCGEGFGDDVILCRECFTPHHKKCFAWNGSCGMYACGSKRFLFYTRTVRNYLALRRQRQQSMPVSATSAQ